MNARKKPCSPFSQILKRFFSHMPIGSILIFLIFRFLLIPPLSDHLVDFIGQNNEGDSHAGDHKDEFDDSRGIYPTLYFNWRRAFHCPVIVCRQQGVQHGDVDQGAAVVLVNAGKGQIDNCVQHEGH